MRGHFVTNEKGKKIAVQIDLDRYDDLWEDFYDQLVAEQRKDARIFDLADARPENVKNA